MTDSNTVQQAGFIELLQLLFIALKLTGYIDWSWWYVMSPFIILGTATFIITIVILVYRK